MAAAKMKSSLDEKLALLAAMSKRQEALMLVAEKSLRETGQVMGAIDSERYMISERTRSYIREFSDIPLTHREEFGVPEEKECDSFHLRFDQSYLGFSVALTRYDNINSIVVDKIYETCPVKNQLKLQDQLITINSEPVPTDVPEADFSELVGRIKNAPRPLTLSFVRPPTNGHYSTHRTSGNVSSRHDHPPSSLPVGKEVEDGEVE